MFYPKCYAFAVKIMQPFSRVSPFNTITIFKPRRICGFSFGSCLFRSIEEVFLWTRVFQVHWVVARHFNTTVLLSRLDLQHMFLKQFSKQHFSTRSPFIYINAEISLETYNNQDKSWAIYPSHFMLVTKIYSTSVSLVGVTNVNTEWFLYYIWWSS